MPYANNNGVKIHYEVEGNGPPLMWQHGFTDALDTWYSLGYVEALKNDYQLILVDARGHGRSDKPHDGESYRPDIVATDYTRILDDLSIEKANYWGYSMGAGFGFQCIARYALSRFNSLILGGAGPGDEQIQANRETAQGFLNTLAWAAEKGTEVWLASMEKNGSKLDPRYRSLILKSDPAALLALVKAQTDWPGASDILPKINIPCLVYAGELDASFAKARKAAEAMPKASFFSLPGLNHITAYLRSDLVLPHVRKFLA